MDGDLETFYATIATVTPVLMLGPLLTGGRVPVNPSGIRDSIAQSVSMIFLMVFAFAGCAAISLALIGLSVPSEQLSDFPEWIVPMMALVVVYLAAFNMAAALYPRYKKGFLYSWGRLRRDRGAN